MTARNICMAAAGGGRPLPVFVSSSFTLGSSPVVVTAPSGIQDGDLLVALAVNANADNLFTFPSGFSVIYNEPVNQPSLAIGFKIASSESGNYSFTSSGSSSSVSILVYRNATRVNTIGSTQYAGTASVAAPSITPTFAGTLLGVFIQRNAGTYTITTPPSGMTNRVTATPSSTRPQTYIYDQSQNASATGDKTATWSDTGSFASLLLQITNEPTVAPEFVASASTQNDSTDRLLTISKPTGTVEGDLMVAVMGNNESATWTGDTGWTEVADQGSRPSVRIAYKVVGASEGASYTFTASRDGTLTGCILTYRYAAYDTIGSFVTGANPLVLSSISPSESQSILIAAGARETASATLGTPTSMTARVADANATSPSYIVCDQTVAKGQTGTSLMSTGSTSNVAGIMLTLKPTRALT